VLEWDAQNEV
ncbi:unnamed protein product, partial [Fusarium fujikuroi]